MKIKYCTLLFVGIVAALPAFAQPMMNPASAPPTNSPPPDKAKLNIFIGSSFGRNLAQPGIKELIDYDVLLKAMKDYVDGKPEMTDAEMQGVFRELQAYMASKRREQAEQTKKEGEDFLAKNAKEDGVKSLPDGLQYKVVKEGSGAHPSTNDTVTVKYKGTLIDGTEFDHNDSVKLSLMRVVKGWQEALPMMNVGSEWKLFIPSDLGYGPRGSGPKIPGNSVLLFDIEVLATEAAPKPVSTAMPPAGGVSPTGTNSIVSGQIIKVPSAEGLKRGEKIEVNENGKTNAVDSAK